MKAWIATSIVLAVSHFGASGAAARASQDAYVWQRVWSDAVCESVLQHGSCFSNLLVLSAEVTWKNKQPHLIRPAIAYPVLAKSGPRVGLVLRIGPYPGPFSASDPVTGYLSNLAVSLVGQARTNHVEPNEFQIDFDCAEAKLDGYRIWVEALRKRVAPLPLTITALPAWLKSPAFKSLVMATDGYVLQVHSLERPRGVDTPFTLCDPVAAQRAVVDAARIGVPFRVALPTYGYVIAFNASGQFVGLSAEGPRKTWPKGVQLREVRSDPLQMFQLAQFWSTNLPSALGSSPASRGASPLRGIIWYRLPVTDDILNWRWPTIDSILAGRAPRESLRAEPRRVEPGLVEIHLVNNGEIDISSRLAIEVRWSREGGTRLVAGDALRGFEMVDAGPSTVRFETKSRLLRLPVGDKQVIGWLRFNEDREVQVEVTKRSEKE